MNKTKFKLKNLFIIVSIIAAIAVVSGCGDGFRDKGTLDITQLKDWQIFVPHDAIPSENYAAQEFKHWYELSTGINLPIVNERLKKRNYIFIGSGGDINELSAGINTISFGQEDLFIDIQQNSIIITGGRPRGTLYGVYSFLEKYLDIRFLTSEHTYVPKLKNKLIKLPENYIYRPPLQFRLSYYGETLRNPEFAVRLRNNAQIRSDDIEKFGGNTQLGRVNHSFHRQIPSSEYGKEHPEYFALHDGIRRNKANFFEGFEVQPCLSNPDVLDIVVESVVDELKGNPGRSFISVAQNDNNFYCQCSDCVAIDKQEGSQSGSLLQFVNSVAEKVEKKYPDAIIGTFAYNYTLDPPKNIRPSDNVLIQLCNIGCSQIFSLDDSRSSANNKFVKNAESWSRICDNINVWTYNTNFHNYLLPCPNLWNIEPNIRFFVRNNAKGIFMQAQGNNVGGSFSDLRNYVTSMLLWNPELSGEELIDEFLTIHYGGAASPIRSWLLQLRSSALERGTIKDKGCFAPPEDYGITSEVAQAGIEVFQQALTLADNDEIRRRVEKASIYAYRAAVGDLPFLLSANRYSRWKKDLWSPEAEEQLSPEAVKHARPYMRKLVELCRKYEVPRWSEAWTLEDALIIWRQVFGMEENESF